MKKALLDTDTLINFFKNDPKTVEQTKNYLRSFPRLTISEITCFEYIKGLEYRNAIKKSLMFDLFLEENEIVGTNLDSIKISARIYGDLRREGITIGTSDLLIAGIAIQHNLELITNNMGHFRHIEGLQINNWK